MIDQQPRSAGRCGIFTDPRVRPARLEASDAGEERFVRRGGVE
jgi:hypothetical protein